MFDEFTAASNSKRFLKITVFTVFKYFPNTLFVYVCIIALSITVHNLLVLMNYLPNEVLYVLSVLLKFPYKVLPT